MRITLLAIIACAVGCVDVGPGTHGETLKHYAGTVSVVFTNATPNTMCNLSMSADNSDSYGDNWLPAAGLPSGKSIEFHVQPGRYKATWNTCHHQGANPYYAGTLFRERSFEVKKDALQLFAYIADTVAPTKRAAVVAAHQMVRFEGMAISADTGRVAEKPEVVAAAAPAEPAPAHFDAKDWIDAKAAAKKPAIRPSLKRTHDMAEDARVSYRAK
jgi:hypothetical protein